MAETSAQQLVQAPGKQCTA